MFVPKSGKVGVHKIPIHFTKSRDFYLMEVATNSEALSLTKRDFIDKEYKRKPSLFRNLLYCLG